jgi:uncharacterized protein YecT (DUF1311 family)
MRHNLPVIALIAALALHVGGGTAQADCATSNTEFDDFYCDAKLFIAADDDLNAAYKALTAKLSGPPRQGEMTAVLKMSQLAWMEKRNEECGRTDSDGYYVDLSCAADFTRNRTQFLSARKAECDAGQCDISKLAEVD